VAPKQDRGETATYGKQRSYCFRAAWQGGFTSVPGPRETPATVGAYFQAIRTILVGGAERGSSQVWLPRGEVGDHENDSTAGSGASLLWLTGSGFYAILPFET
jgi:hypothetical protein